MQENELGGLGIFRIPVPIPFRQAGGPANVYAIEEEHGLLLFDAGLGTEQAQAALAAGLARTGHRFEEVNRIILSHGHIDHFGAAAWIQEQTGRAVPIWIHNADADKVLESGADWPALIMRNSGYLTRLGVPLPVLEETAAVIGRNAGMGRRLADVTPLLPGDKFRCRHVTLEVHSMPGHTPGLCCLYEREHRLLFSGDHFLERVSPNPLMDLRPEGEPTSFKPLVTYFESLDRVRALPIDLVLPGHAAPFSAPIEVINSLSAFYERRQAKLLDMLGHRPLTVYEAMRELFANSSAFELILTLSETLGNLELLEKKGKIVRETDGTFIRFRIGTNSTIV
jgi:glyoxylase-like metal-dependent hydrolase (beta-lactamase superfamily II)